MKHFKMIALAASSLALTGQALAITVFQGTDPGTAFGDPRPNSNQAASDFDTIAGSMNAITVLTWENQAVGSNPPYGPFPEPLDCLTSVTHTNGAASSISAVNTDQLGYNTTFGGSKFLQIIPDANDNTNVTTFNFNRGISAFGLYITGLQDDFPGDISMRFIDSLGNPQIINVIKPAPVNNKTSTMFLGFTDVANANIMSVEIWNVGDHTTTRDVYGFDDVRFTCACVPEPTTMGALAFGLVAIARKRRR